MKYKNGIDFSPSTVLVLSNLVGGAIDDDKLDTVKQSMFLRSDGLFYLLDEVADDDTIKNIKDTIEQYLESYGCFETIAMWEHYKPVINENIIQSSSDFESLTTHLMKDQFHIMGYYNTQFGKKQRIGFSNTFNKCVSEIEKIVCDDYGGVLPEESLATLLFGFSRKILQKIIRDYSHTLYFVSINDSECIQHQDYIGLPDDISSTINKVIEKMEYIGLPLTLEAIHIGMSLEMNASFKDEFGVNDDTFKTIIERNCTLTPVHRWDRSVFREVRE